MNVSDFEIVVGLELHIQLNTQSKIFSADANTFGGDPNSHTHVISLAHPGTLPVLNQSAVDKAILLALAIDAEINPVNRFDRKHYFYPDLPKAYQITQDNIPICRGGNVHISVDGVQKRIGIHHIHMEEDAGKSIHSEAEAESLVDLNRAGVPLLELVTQPDLRAGQEVHDFIEKLQQLVKYLGISDAQMEEGSLRCDCNVSVRPKGSIELGERCEIKNLNSKKFAMKAVEAEAKRQIQSILSGQKITRQTLHFDPVTEKSYPAREKESAMDYRYFPDPDLPPVRITRERIASLRQSMPELPDALRKRMVREFELNAYQSELISRDAEIAEFFLELANQYKVYPSIANLLINKLIPYSKENELPFRAISVPDEHFIEFIELIDEGKVLSSLAYRDLFPEMMSNPRVKPETLAINLGLIKLQSKEVDLDGIVENLIRSFPEEAGKYRKGKKSVIGFFIGQAMKETKGSVHPNAIKKKLEEAL